MDWTSKEKQYDEMLEDTSGGWINEDKEDGNLQMETDAKIQTQTDCHSSDFPFPLSYICNSVMRNSQAAPSYPFSSVQL